MAHWVNRNTVNAEGQRTVAYLFMIDVMDATLENVTLCPSEKVVENYRTRAFGRNPLWALVLRIRPNHGLTLAECGQDKDW